MMQSGGRGKKMAARFTYQRCAKDEQRRGRQQILHDGEAADGNSGSGRFSALGET